MPKNPKKDAKNAKNNDEKFKGFICPLMSRGAPVYCVRKQCQLWIPYTIEGPESTGMTFECAFWLQAMSTHLLAQNLFILRKEVRRLVDRPAVAASPAAAATEISKNETVEYLKRYEPDVTVAVTADGVNLQGWVKDDAKREEMFQWLKGQGFRFHREGPVKCWFKEFTKEG